MLLQRLVVVFLLGKLREALMQRVLQMFILERKLVQTLPTDQMLLLEDQPQVLLQQVITIRLLDMMQETVLPQVTTM